GRLKSPAWVAQAVALYRQAIRNPETPAALRAEAERLGEYTGRLMSSGYFEGDRQGLTAPSARPASSAQPRRHEPEATDRNLDSGLAITVTTDGQGATL